MSIAIRAAGAANISHGSMNVSRNINSNKSGLNLNDSSSMFQSNNFDIPEKRYELMTKEEKEEYATTHYITGEEITARVKLDDNCYYLTTKLDGDELEKKVQEETDYFKQKDYLIDKRPRFETTFRDVEILNKNKIPTLAEADFLKRMCKAENDTKSITVKRSDVPRFFVKTADGKLRKLDLEGKHLIGGQEATAVWRVYGDSHYLPNIKFEGLIFDKEPKITKESLLMAVRNKFDIHPDIELVVDRDTILFATSIQLNPEQSIELKDLLNKNGELNIMVPICDKDLNPIESDLKSLIIDQVTNAYVQKAEEYATKAAMIQDVFETSKEIQLRETLNDPFSIESEPDLVD